MATDINNKKRKAMTEEEKTAAVAAILAEEDSSDEDSEVGVVAEATGVASATVPVMNPYIGDRGRAAASSGSVDSSEDMYRNYLLQQRQQLIEAHVLRQQQQRMQFAVGPGPNIIDKPTAKHKSKNYTKAEVTCLLKFYRAHKPVGRSGVERVRVGMLSEGYDRDIDSIKRKFRLLYRQKENAPPSGNPRCPPAVTEAYEIHQLIGDEVNVGNCNEQYDVVNNVFGVNNDGTNQVQYSNDEEEFDEDGNPTTVVITTTTPPPSRTGLLHGASTGGSSGNKNVFSFIDQQMKMEAEQRSVDREERKEQREEDRRRREEEREDDNRRHRQLMELMANAVGGITSALKK